MLGCTDAGDEKALMPLQGGEGKREVRVREGEERKEGFKKKPKWRRFMTKRDYRVQHASRQEKRTQKRSTSPRLPPSPPLSPSFRPRMSAYYLLDSL